jgi:hypothetical protein
MTHNLLVNQPDYVDNQDAPVVPTTLAVYRNLRIGLGVTAVTLLASIVIHSTWEQRPTGKNCWQGALSEYFYTSAHSVFIASLLGLATLFFIYRGSSDTENALLTLAGVAAVTAALVPQGEDYIKHCTPLFIPDDVKVADAIRPNMWAIVAALGLAFIITQFQRWYDRKDGDGNKIRQPQSTGGKWARYLLCVVVVVGLIALCAPQDTRDVAHGVAGFLLLSSFIATVFATAHLAKREVWSPRGPKFQRRYQTFYRWWRWVMLGTFFGILAVQVIWPEFFGGLWGTYLEAAVTLEFCVYWGVQTFDLWDDPDRRYRLSDDDRARLAQRYIPPQGILPTDMTPPTFDDKVMSFL